MGSGMSQIAPQLFLGSLRDCNNTEAMAENKITHVVSVIDDHSLNRLLDATKGGTVTRHPSLAGVVIQEAPTIKRLGISANDHPEQDLSPYFQVAAEYIQTARQNGGRVLVHCMAGISRSTTLCIAYLLSITDDDNWDVIKIIDAVRAQRRQINPNAGFRMQLVKFASNVDKRGKVTQSLADIKAKSKSPLEDGNEVAFMDRSLEKAAQADDEGTVNPRMRPADRAGMAPCAETFRYAKDALRGKKSDGNGDDSGDDDGEDRSKEDVKAMLVGGSVSSEAITRLEVNGLLKMQPLLSALQKEDGPGNLQTLLQSIDITTDDAKKVKQVLESK